jgi:hypothetical protein
MKLRNTPYERVLNAIAINGELNIREICIKTRYGRQQVASLVSKGMSQNRILCSGHTFRINPNQED